MASEKNHQKKSTRGDAAGVGAYYEVPEVCTRQFFRQSPLRGYTGVCKLVHSFVHEYWEDRIVRYVQKKAPRLFEVKWQGDEIRRLAHAFHSGQREYINASVRGPVAPVVLPVQPERTSTRGSTLAVLLAWMQAECFFHPSLKVCFLVDDEKSQQMVQDGLRCAYLSVRLASRSKGLSVAEDVILVADGDGSPFGDTLPVLYPMRGMLYGPRIFALLQRIFFC